MSLDQNPRTWKKERTTRIKLTVYNIRSSYIIYIIRFRYPHEKPPELGVILLLYYIVHHNMDIIITSLLKTENRPACPSTPPQPPTTTRGALFFFCVWWSLKWVLSRILSRACIVGVCGRVLGSWTSSPPSACEPNVPLILGDKTYWSCIAGRSNPTRNQNIRE